MKYVDFKRKVALKKVVVSRLENLIADGYSNNIVENVKNKLEDCSTLTYHKDCKDCGKKFYAGSNSCNNRFCPVCAKKRSLKNIAVLLPAFKRYLDKGCTVHLLTLTIENTTDFMDGLNKILKAFRYMTHDNKFYARIFKYSFVGGVKSLEIIRGITDDETYHAHLHLLVIKDKFTRDFEVLKEIWNNSVNNAFGTTGKKLGSIHIKQVRNKNIYSNKPQTLQDVKTGLLETLKYITKVEDIFDYENGMLRDFITFSHNRRYISVFGGLAKLSIAINKDIDESVEKSIKQVCKFCGCTEFEFKSEFTSYCGPLEDFE